MYLLGIDIGTSSVTVSLVNSLNQQAVISKKWPDTESPIVSIRNSWTEQSPELWWEYVQRAILLCHNAVDFHKKEIAAIGVSCQMHGLVMIDNAFHVLRNNIISYDSRACAIGKDAYNEIGEEYCLGHLLNSPGIFTAAKLSWVKKYEIEVYEKIFKVMQLGDYIAMRLTGEITTTIPALSEGIFYDFRNDEISKEVLKHFDFERSIFPDQKKVFSSHGHLLQSVADQLHLKKEITVSYKAGNLLTTALALNVMNPGEIAACCGDSGSLIGISDKLTADRRLRMNVLAHVNYAPKRKRLGIVSTIKGVD